MTHITVGSVMAAKPCVDYPQKRVAALFGNHTTVPLLAVRAPSGGWCAPTQKAHYSESELQIEQAIDILHDDANTDA